MPMFKLFKKEPKNHAKPAVKKIKPAAKHAKPAKHAPVHAKIEHKEAKHEVKAEFKKMSDEKAYELIKKYRIHTPEYSFCKTEADLKESIKKVGFPMAMKVSGSIIHKTNVSGVRLNIANEADAETAFSELIKIKGADSVLVQKMVTEGYELIIGGKKDPQFNRVVALGAGGVLTEVMKDVSFRIAPLTKEDAQQMVHEVKFSDLILKGFRGQKPADENAIIEAILAVSKIIENNPSIKELDINPLFASSSGAVAADVRIILE
jgi:acetate---CoA ligase (ADP-forming) subunit beta